MAERVQADGVPGPRVLAVTRELSASAATQRDIAARLGCSQSRVSMARAVLKHAPELAGPVIAGTMSFGRAYLVARERRNARRGIPALQDRYLTVTEAAAMLGTVPAAVVEMLGAGTLASARPALDRQSLTVAQIAGILGCSISGVYTRLRSGELIATQAGDRGHYRITAQELRRYLLASVTSPSRPAATR